jgi:uncharacterized protein YegP (UPF0339 family)
MKQKSSSNERLQGYPGFEIFQDEENTGWFFHCNDIHGHPLLLSARYQYPEQARKGMEAVLKNVLKRSAVSKQGEVWQFVVVSGNQQEIARSISFESSADCEQALRYVQQVARAKQPMAVSVPVEADSDKSPVKETEAPAAEQKAALLRHSFRLYFYQDDHGAWSGRIEDLAKHEAQGFEGIGITTIETFLNRRLGIPPAVPDPPPVSTSKPGIRFQTLKGHLAFADAQTPTAASFRLSLPEEQLQMSLSAEKTANLSADCSLAHLALTARQTQSGQQHSLKIERVHFDAQACQVVFYVHVPSQPGTGTYTLAAEAQLYTPQGNHSLQGAAMIHLI